MSNRVFKRIQCEVDSNNLVYQRNSRDITLSNEKILIKIFRGDNKYKYLPSSYLNKRVIYDLDMTNLEYMASKGMFNLIKLFIEEKNEEYIKNIISSSPYTMKEAIASGNMFLVEYLFNKGFRAEDGDLSSMVNTYERNIVYAYDLYCELCDEFEETQNKSKHKKTQSNIMMHMVLEQAVVLELQLVKLIYLQLT